MRSSIASLLAALVLVSVLVAGCGQTQPPAAPQQPSAAVAPTSAPAPAQAQPTPIPAPPTTAPAKKVEFPEKGKPITIIVPYPAGGGVDVAARLIAPVVEKDLGVSVQVVNKVGAGGQVGWTDLVAAKPDGYTIGYTIQSVVTMTWLDPERKATYSRKNFQPIVNHFMQQLVILVPADSPFKTVKDVVDAAKANPGKVSCGATGIGGVSHVAALQFARAAGIDMSIVQFDGDAPQVAALVGGHLDISINPIGAVLSQAKAGQIRLIGIADKERSAAAPDVKTLDEQGYKVYGAAVGGISGPAGIPQDVVATLAASLRKAIEGAEQKQKMQDLGYTVRFMDTPTYVDYWNSLETEIAPLVKLLR